MSLCVVLTGCVCLGGGGGRPNMQQQQQQHPGMPPPAGGVGAGGVPLQDAIRTVMTLSEAQIQSLPPDKAAQLMALRRDLLAKQAAQQQQNN